MDKEKQKRFDCKHLECNMDGCYCGVGHGHGYGHCVIPYEQATCKYFERKPKTRTVKITENEIVISKEEYEKIWRNGWNEGYSEIQDDTVKETAEKILLKIKEVKTQDCGYTDWFDDTYFGEEFMKLAKEFGVDLGEEK